MDHDLCSDVPHGIIYNRKHRRTVALNLMKWFCRVTMNDVYGEFAVTQAAKADIG